MMKTTTTDLIWCSILLVSCVHFEISSLHVQYIVHAYLIMTTMSCGCTLFANQHFGDLGAAELQQTASHWDFFLQWWCSEGLQNTDTEH